MIDIRTAGMPLKLLANKNLIEKIRLFVSYFTIFIDLIFYNVLNTFASVKDLKCETILIYNKDDLCIRKCFGGLKDVIF